MSVKAIKRFALGAKNSISTLNPFNDGQSESHMSIQMITTMDEKCLALQENSGPPHQFANSSSAEFNRSSSDRDSPSRRRRFVGSLRNMSSMRRLRSLPQHQHVAKPAVDEYEHEISYTPSSKTHTSLQLDFEQSSSDHPFLDFEGRKSSISSLIVRHSSPLPIIASTPKESHADQTLGCTSPSLPDGTVPSAPAPIQLILEEDLKRRAMADSERSPLPNTKVQKESLATPLNGTNPSFDPQDCDKVNWCVHDQRISNDYTTGYFSLMSAERQNEETQPRRQQKIEVHNNRTGLNSYAGRLTSFTDEDTSRIVAEPATQDYEHNAISQGLGKSHNTGTKLHGMASVNGSMDSDCDLEDMKHLLYLDYCGVDIDPANPRLCKRAFAKGGPADPLGPDTTHVVHADHRYVNTGPDTANDNDSSTSVQEYQQSHDNIVHGKECSSIQPPSYTAAQAVVQAPEYESTTACRVASGKDSTEACCDSSCKPGIRNPSITSMDHETLEEVIRAYAAYNGDRASSTDGTISNHVSDEVGVETRVCVELAHRMAA